MIRLLAVPLIMGLGGCALFDSLLDGLAGLTGRYVGSSLAGLSKPPPVVDCPYLRAPPVKVIRVLEDARDPVVDDYVVDLSQLYDDLDICHAAATNGVASR